MVVFFDIDGTLVDSDGAGLDAFVRGFAEVAGIKVEQVPPIELGGAVDSALLVELGASLGGSLRLRPEDFYPRYLECLRENLVSDRFAPRLLPGARELVALCAETPGVTAGLITGNVRAGAQTKLDHFGLWEHFVLGGFGDDAEERSGVAKAGIQRALDADCAGDVGDWWVLGDTPKDVLCARENGVHAAAVASGSATIQELETCRPDLLFKDLENPAEVFSRLWDWHS